MKFSPIDVDPATLKPNPWNSNIVSPEHEEKLDASLRRLGLFKPVVCRELEDGSLQILGGEHRSQSAVRIGLEEIPVFNLGRISDERAKEISLADNARYGADDTIALAEIFESIGSDVSEFLPFTDSDLQSIFASVDVNLDELEIDENVDLSNETPEIAQAKTPKTHAMMRFKVPISDAESITALIARTQKKHGLTQDDELTNAGDALVHLLLGGTGSIGEDDLDLHDGDA